MANTVTDAAYSTRDNTDNVFWSAWDACDHVVYINSIASVNWGHIW